MLVKIELPKNEKELSFVLEVLKRLNIQIVAEEQDSPLTKEIAANHSAILKERRKTMTAPDATFYSWEAAKEILAKRAND